MFQSFPFPTNCPLWVELWSFLGFTRTGGQVVAGHLLSPFIVGLKQFALTRLDDIHLNTDLLSRHRSGSTENI